MGIAIFGAVDTSKSAKAAEPEDHCETPNNCATTSPPLDETPTDLEQEAPFLMVAIGLAVVAIFVVVIRKKKP